jgi:hypothetical protein
MFQQVRGSIRLFSFRFDRRQVCACLFQCSQPIPCEGTLGDRPARSTQIPAGVGGGENRPRQAQAIQVVPGEEAITAGAPLDRRDQSPLQVAADRVRVDADSAGQV